MAKNDENPVLWWGAGCSRWGEPPPDQVHGVGQAGMCPLLGLNPDMTDAGLLSSHSSPLTGKSTEAGEGQACTPQMLGGVGLPRARLESRGLPPACPTGPQQSAPLEKYTLLCTSGSAGPARWAVGRGACTVLGGHRT